MTTMTDSKAADVLVNVEPSAPVGVERKYPDDGNGDDDAYNRGWNDCLAALAQQPAAEYKRQQPCGCVLCVCEDEKQCHGCGAKHCGNRTDHPAYAAQQPAAETVTVQQAWEWAGGNPGITATREDLEQALRVLDAVCDEADQKPAAVDGVGHD